MQFLIAFSFLVYFSCFVAGVMELVSNCWVKVLGSGVDWTGLDWGERD